MTKFEFGRGLRAHFHTSRQPPGQHPSADDLVAYRSATLRREKEQQVRDHLVACEQCSELLLDLVEFEDQGGLAKAHSQAEIDAAWERQRERLFPGRHMIGRWSVQMGGWLAAACLALIAGTLVLQTRELRQSSALLYAQDLPRVIVDGSEVRSLDAELPVLKFETGKPGFLLILLKKNLLVESFRVEFLTRKGQVLLTREGLSASEDLLLVPIRPDVLPSGRVRIMVSGLREGQFAAVEEYALRIEHP